MDSPVDFTTIYIDSMMGDFEDFIKLLNNPPTSLETIHKDFKSEFFNAYLALYKSELAKVNILLAELVDDRAKRPNGDEDKDSPINRKNAYREEVAYEAAKYLYREMGIPEEFRGIFINIVAHCLTCRFKSIRDPMDHQIRNGTRNKRVEVEATKDANAEM